MRYLALLALLLSLGCYRVNRPDSPHLIAMWEGAYVTCDLRPGDSHTKARHAHLAVRAWVTNATEETDRYHIAVFVPGVNKIIHFRPPSSLPIELTIPAMPWQVVSAQVLLMDDAHQVHQSADLSVAVANCDE